MRLNEAIQTVPQEQPKRYRLDEVMAMETPEVQKSVNRGFGEKVKFFLGESAKALPRAIETVPAQFEALVQVAEDQIRGIAKKQLAEEGAVFGRSIEGRTPEQTARIAENNKIVMNMDSAIDTSKRLQANWIEAAYTGIEAPDPELFRGSFMENPSFTRAVALGIQSVPMLGLAAAITAATKSPTAGAALLGSLEAAEEHNIQRELGGSEGEALGTFVVNTLALSFLESIPLTGFMKGGALPIRAFRGAIQEGSEEVLQSLWKDSVAKIGYDDTRKLTANLVESFIAGAISGGVIGGFSPVAGIQKSMDKASKKGVEVDKMIEAVSKQVTNEADNLTEIIASDSNLDTTEAIAPVVDPLIEEAKKYKSAEEFIGNTKIIPETARVWLKSKFSDKGGYTDFPIIRKEENITLYQGGSKDVRQFWTPNKKYASQFGEVTEKTGTFYKVDNGNRMTDVYVDAKAQLTDIYNKAKVDKVADPLITEAKKYKSAEEFVESQKDELAGASQTVRADLNEIGFDLGLFDLAIENGATFEGLYGMIKSAVGENKDVGVYTSTFSENLKALVDNKRKLSQEVKTKQQLTDIFNLAQPKDPKLIKEVSPELKHPVSIREGSEQLIDPDKSLNDAFTDIKDSFFTERDTRIFDSKIEKRSLQKEILNALGQKKYDANAKDIDRAIHIAIDSKRNIDHVTELFDKLTPEQKSIVALSQNLPPKVQDIVERIEKSYRELGLEALDAGVIRNVLDGYANRIWDLENKSATELGKKFGATTRHAKQRKFETIIEGMSKGFNLKVESATNNLQILKEEISKAIASKNLINQMKKTKNLDGQPLATTKFIEGYSKIDVPNFIQWRHAGEVTEGKSYGKNFFIQENMLFERQDLYAPKDVAKRINKIFGVSGLKDVPGIKTLTKYNAIAKAWILQSSLFHHLAFMRSYYLGTNNKRFGEMDVIQAYQSGIKSIEMSDPNVRLGVANGLTLGLRQDWEENLLQEKTIIGKTIDKIPGGTKVKDKILGLRQAQADFLFGEFGAGLKAKSFLIELRNHQKAHPDLTADQAAKEVANLINDDFGGLHLERLERNPTLQHIFRLLMLAPDWTESNIRTMVKSVNASKASETDMYRKFWAGILVKGALLTALSNMLMSAFDEDDEQAKGTIEKFFRNYKRAWKEGNLKATKVDVTPIYKLFGGDTERRKYFSILGHFTDPMKFILHPIKSAKHKGSVLFNFFYDAVTGTDWAGRRFTTLPELIGQDKDKGLYKTSRTGKYKKGDPKFGKLKGKTVTFDYKRHPLTYEQTPSYLVNKLKGVQPVQVQNGISWMMGEMEGFDALANSLGLGITSTYGDD